MDRQRTGKGRAKRILLGNINSTTGKLDNDKAVTALMAHRNTPCQQTGISPVVALFGRPIRDHLPLKDRTLRKEWREIATKREEALAKRHLVHQNRSTEQPMQLAPLDIGDSVQIQNQHGVRPTKWNTTGFVTEILPHRQCRVVVDGSRHITLRNRRFLHKILPVCRQSETAINPSPNTNSDQRTVIQPAPLTNNVNGNQVTPTTTATTAPNKMEQHTETIPQPPHETTPLRRSTRERRPPRPLSPKLSRQSHDG